MEGRYYGNTLIDAPMSNSYGIKRGTKKIAAGIFYLIRNGDFMGEFYTKKPENFSVRKDYELARGGLTTPDAAGNQAGVNRIDVRLSQAEKWERLADYNKFLAVEWSENAGCFYYIQANNNDED
jgi:hypothetical protein